MSNTRQAIGSCSPLQISLWRQGCCKQLIAQRPLWCPDLVSSKPRKECCDVRRSVVNCSHGPPWRHTEIAATPFIYNCEQSYRDRRDFMPHNQLWAVGCRNRCRCPSNNALVYVRAPGTRSHAKSMPYYSHMPIVRITIRLFLCIIHCMETYDDWVIAPSYGKSRVCFAFVARRTKVTDVVTVVWDYIMRVSTGACENTACQQGYIFWFVCLSPS